MSDLIVIISWQDCEKYLKPNSKRYSPCEARRYICIFGGLNGFFSLLVSTAAASTSQLARERGSLFKFLQPTKSGSGGRKRVAPSPKRTTLKFVCLSDRNMVRIIILLCWYAEACISVYLRWPNKTQLQNMLCHVVPVYEEVHIILYAMLVQHTPVLFLWR